MFQLSQPEELFRHQTLYRITGNVDKSGTLMPAYHKLVVVLPQAVDQLPAAVKEMAEKLIAACKVNAAEVVYLDGGSYAVSYQAIKSAYQPEVILFFGDIPISRNINGLKKNVPYEFNGVKILLAQTLEYIAKTPAEKKALWVGLQELFGV